MEQQRIDEQTEKTFQLCREHNGWTSECYRSSYPSQNLIPYYMRTTAFPFLDWKPAREYKHPQRGWIYAVEEGTICEGYIGVAKKQYWRRMKTRAIKAELKDGDILYSPEEIYNHWDEVVKFYQLDNENNWREVKHG